MKEVEILFYLNESIESAKEKLSGFKFIGNSNVCDVYFKVPKKTCLRIRKTDINNFLTHKQDIFKDNIWLYSEETETKVECFDVTRAILNNFFVEWIEIDMEKIKFENEKYNIILEIVKNTSNFFEVELKNCDEGVKIAKQKIRDFVKEIGISCEEVINDGGKPEIVEESREKRDSN